MKNRTRDGTIQHEGELVATFGDAHLIRLKGKLFLRGGSMADRTEALEWTAKFLPDEVACVRR